MMYPNDFRIYNRLILDYSFSSFLLLLLLINCEKCDKSLQLQQFLLLVLDCDRYCVLC